MKTPKVYLNEHETYDMAIRIIKILDGLAISNAMAVLRDTQKILLDTHLVDISSARMAAHIKENSEPSPVCHE